MRLETAALTSVLALGIAACDSATAPTTPEANVTAQPAMLSSSPPTDPLID
jgi:hypothetical protein